MSHESTDPNDQQLALAPDVHLHGEMPDVGFTTKQWLIERNGQFLQVSELLYRVAEQMDGQRSAAEIARRVSDTSEWALEPEHVEYLLEKKLRPLGIVADADGQIARSTGSRSSPLRLNMRMRMLPPRFVAALTSVFRFAYAPAVLIPTAALIAYAHWWLYSGSGGVARGIESALYQPGAMGAVLLLTIVAGLFHELGHSSALRYGGGKPRGIGFGLYLIFPAFYSDVTDSYRLGRGARIRTDLGGIYFHLIFAAVLIGLSAWTGNQFLVAAAVVFNVEASRQLIPFIRLDGYWLLADLTGVPDFLSQIRSFVRSVRSRGRHTTGLPQFKRWVTVVFGVYLLLSIPATLGLLVFMVMYLPDLWVLTHNALLVQTQIWSAVQDSLTRVLVAVQIALLPLPLVATSYFLYLTLAAVAAQIVARFGWTSGTVPVRRLAGATAIAGAAAFVALAWAPHTPGPSAAFAAAGANAVDPAALLDRVRASTSRVQTLEADLDGSLGDETFTGTLALSRPNRAHVHVRGSTSSLGTFSVISDGTKLFVFFPEENKYTEAKAAADGSNINAFIVDQVRTFFKPERLTLRAGHLSHVGKGELDGVTHDVLEMRAPGQEASGTWRYYISPGDYLLRGVEMMDPREGKRSRLVRLTNVRINGTVEEARFRWSVPAGAAPLGLESLGVALPLPRSKR